MDSSKFEKIWRVSRFLVAAGVLLGCAAKKPTQGLQTRETVKTIIKHDSVYVHDTLARFDSISRHDSMAIRMAGDTVFVERWHKVREVRNAEQKTSSSQRTEESATDTVRICVPYPIESKLTRWEQIKQDVGGLALGALGVAIVALAVWLCRRLHLFARGKI